MVCETVQERRWTCVKSGSWDWLSEHGKVYATPVTAMP